jgi:hypothetical protein
VGFLFCFCVCKEIAQACADNTLEIVKKEVCVCVSVSEFYSVSVSVCVCVHACMYAWVWGHAYMLYLCFNIHAYRNLHTCIHFIHQCWLAPTSFLKNKAENIHTCIHTYKNTYTGSTAQATSRTSLGHTI